MSYCKLPDCHSPIENPTLGLCARHNRESRKLIETSSKEIVPDKPIRKVSKGLAQRLTIYNKLVKRWIVGKKCAVRGCHEPATQCHHARGRENDLLLDTGYWVAVCTDCHRKITDDSAWAIANGYSVSRLGIVNQTQDI